MAHILEFLNVTKIYKGSVNALNDVSFTVDEGEIFGLLGPNGAGKTTIMKIFLTLVYPSSGTIKAFGADIYQSSDYKSKIGFMPEENAGHLSDTPVSHLMFHGRLLGIESSKLKVIIPNILNQVGLTDANDREIRKLSKGMKQRLKLAQAILSDPPLLLLDEPTSGLDPIARKEVRDLILQKKKEGKTIILNSHLLSEIEMVCDRIMIINKGRILKIGTPKDLPEESQSLEDFFYSLIKENS